jgi:carboxylesterase
LPGPAVLEGAEEFALGDGPVGALLIHGFTSSPQNMRALGAYLADRGIATVGIRLPGHGTTWQDLNTRTAADWVEAVKLGYEQLSRGRDEVFLVALSFGAALALDFAARHPGEVSGLVTLGGFVRTKDPRRLFAPVIGRLAASLPGISNDIADPAGRELAYDRLPAAAAASMLALIRRVRRRLGEVRCPILVMHGRNDHTVHPDNARLIYDSVSSPDKELVWCERSYHVITLDYDKDDVFHRTYRFIKERSRHAL